MTLRAPISSPPVIFAVFGGALICAGVALLASPAEAACVQSGATVDCMGNDFNGFLTSQSVTLRVHPGAFINNVITNDQVGNCPLSFPALQVGEASSVLNEALIGTAGVCGFGIVADRGSSITNRGTIRTSDLVSYAIIADDNGIVRNAGSITTDLASSSGVLGGNGMRIFTDLGSSIVTAGQGSSGIEVGSNALITHAGLISVGGQAAFGIDAGLGSSVLNTGSIEISENNSMGIRVAGGSVTNLGSIRSILSGPALALTPTVGVSVVGQSAIFTNAPTGRVTANHIGVRIGGVEHASLSNSGVIDASPAIQVDGTTSLNGGAIVLTGAAVAEISNSGMIRGRDGLPAVRSLGPAVSLRNAGTIIGDVLLAGGNDTVFFTGAGTIEGAVDFGAGNDTVVVQRGGRLDTTMANLEIFSKSGLNTLLLARNLIASDQIVIVAGTLEIAHGVQATSRLIDNAAFLRGSGTLVGALDNGGTLAPGTQVEKGTLTVSGAFRQFANGILAVRLSPQGTSDKLVVGGPATFGGTLALTYDMTPGGPSFHDGQRIEVVAPAASTLTSTGQFILAAPRLTFLHAQLVTSSNGGLAIEFDRLSYSVAAVSESQESVAKMLDRLQTVPPVALSATFERIEDSSLEDATAILGAFAPEAPAAAQDLGLMALERFDESLRSRTPLRTGRGHLVWTRGFTSSGHTRAAELRGHYEQTGIAGGIETSFGDGQLGIAAARIRSDFARGVDAFKFDTSLFALTARYGWENFSFDGSVGYGSGSPDVRRTRAIGGNAETLASQAETDLWTFSAEATYRTIIGPFSVAPHLGAAHHRIRLSELNEGRALGVQTEIAQRKSLRAKAGVRAAASLGRLRPFGDLSLSTDLLQSRTEISASLIDVPGSAFTLYGEARRRVAIESEAGLAIAISDSLEAYLVGALTANDVVAGRRLSAGLTFSW